MSTTIPSGTDSEATPGELDAFAQNFFGFDSMAALWQFNWCPWQPALEGAFAYVSATWEFDLQAELHSRLLRWLPDVALASGWAEYLGVPFTPGDTFLDVDNVAVSLNGSAMTVTKCDCVNEWLPGEIVEFSIQGSANGDLGDAPPDYFPGGTYEVYLTVTVTSTSGSYAGMDVLREVVRIAT